MHLNGYNVIKRSEIKYDIPLFKKIYDKHNSPHHTKPTYDFKLICNIDPPNCSDIDDMISYAESDGYHIIGIHITDVVYVLNMFKDIYPNLIDNIYQNIIQTNIWCTMYPSLSKPYGILPDELVKHFLTLDTNGSKYVWSIYIKISDKNQILDVELKPEIIKNKLSLTYDDADKILKDNSNPYLNRISEFVFAHSKETYPNIVSTYDNHLLNSHFIINILMTFANNYVGNYLLSDPEAIYRTTTQTTINSELLQISSYTMNNLNNIHQQMSTINYVHYTSPIRRFTDQYIHLRLYKKMFNIDLVQNLSIINILSKINESLDNMKIINNYFKLLSLVSPTPQKIEAKLIKLKHDPTKNILYLKWLINSDTKIMDKIHNPLLEEISDNKYTMFNRLNIDHKNEKIILEIGKNYNLETELMLVNHSTTLIIGIKYYD